MDCGPTDPRRLTIQLGVIGTTWSIVALVLVVAGALPTVAAAVTTAPRVTLAVAPNVVDNGGEIILSGTATCRSVVIDAYERAPRVRALGPIGQTVLRGRFVAGVRVPFVGQGPARPGLTRLYFEVQCVGNRHTSVRATLLVLGLGLPPTGLDSVPLALTGALAVLGGIALVECTRRRRPCSLGVSNPKTAPYLPIGHSPRRRAVGHSGRVSDTPRPIPSMGATGEPRPEFVGLRREEAEDLARDEGLTTRVLELPITGRVAWHADRRFDRLNLVVDDGRVIRATVG